MIKLIQKQGPCITAFPTYFTCPHCNKQLVLFHTDPVLCGYCSKKLEIKYRSLCKLLEYRIQYHFNYKNFGLPF